MRGRYQVWEYKNNTHYDVMAIQCVYFRYLKQKSLVFFSGLKKGRLNITRQKDFRLLISSQDFKHVHRNSYIKKALFRWNWGVGNTGIFHQTKPIIQQWFKLYKEIRINTDRSDSQTRSGSTSSLKCSKQRGISFFSGKVSKVPPSSLYLHRILTFTISKLMEILLGHLVVKTIIKKSQKSKAMDAQLIPLIGLPLFWHLTTWTTFNVGTLFSTFHMVSSLRKSSHVHFWGSHHSYLSNPSVVFEAK